ncbi:hypothetical protein [Oxynema aestuarii]|jgi:hypothetical protein|uniref:Uncharacterized protein n=1 Tax=Oxynema aestuarii AP17 TaxID=2064643 RepID=A0A6H1TWK1_9CYAN|nr:hypothetical protein [Oxynema aestuarii]QIZ69709.1 hypothetical protein HCG48_03195 [Oxynema aestuarii AP17]
MSEAETPKNRNLPEPSESIAPSELPASEQGTPDPSETPPTESSENRDDGWETVDFPGALSIKALEEQSQESEQPKAESQAKPPEKAVEKLMAGARDAVIERLTQDNRELNGRIEQLETVLQECRQSLQQQRSRALSQQNLLEQRNEELQGTREQIAHLGKELETLHQLSEKQQGTIARLSQQLQTSQERLAQMERECALTQERYNEQSQVLYQTETVCRELRSRLQRQQRHTLQFKAALEKCLDVPGEKAKILEQLQDTPPQELELEESSLETGDRKASPQKNRVASAKEKGERTQEDRPKLSKPSIVPKASPISPWSAPAESPPPQSPVSGQFTLSPLSVDPKGPNVAPQLQPLPPIAAPSPLPGEAEMPTTHEERVWHDLETLIEKNAPSLEGEQPTILTAALLSVETGERSRSGSFGASPQSPSESEPADPATTPTIEVKTDETPQPAPVTPPPQPHGVLETTPQQDRPSAPPSAGSSGRGNWPAPVVYPQQSTSKKRRSLASVELPSFQTPSSSKTE